MMYDISSIIYGTIIIINYISGLNKVIGLFLSIFLCKFSRGMATLKLVMLYLERLRWLLSEIFYMLFFAKSQDRSRVEHCIK